MKGSENIIFCFFEKRQNILIILILSSSVLFFYKLGSRSYWLDEMITLSRTHDTWKSHYSVWPPLYFWLIWVWAKVFGVSEWALRSFSALWGIVSVVSLYYLGVLFSDKVGLFASLLLMFNPLTVYYAQEARGYTMLLGLSTLSMLIFVRILKGSYSKRDWLYLSGINILGSLTHISFTLFVVGQYLVVLAWLHISDEGIEGKAQRNAVIKSLVVWLLVVITYFALANKWVFHRSPAPSRQTALIMADLLGKTLLQKAFLVVLVIWSVLLTFKKPKWGRWFWGYFLPVTVIFLAVFILRNFVGPPVWRVRYLVPLLPVISLICSYPLAHVEIRKALAVVTVWCGLTGIYMLNKHYNGIYEKGNWRESASWLLEHDKGEPVIVNWLKYYRYYYLNCDKIRCIDLKKLTKKLIRQNLDLENAIRSMEGSDIKSNIHEDKIRGLWILYPEGGKWHWNKKLEEILKKKKFVLVKEVRIGKRSRILHFVRQ